MKYRKKPVVIDAVRWNGANIDQVLELVDFDSLPTDGRYVKAGIEHVPALATIDIPTLEGTMTAHAGDWIVKGVKGEVYPVRHDIFTETYEAVE